MNNVKIVFYNTETIDSNAFDSSLVSNSNYVSHIVIKPGLYIVNYRGSAKDLYDSLETIIQENSFFVHDLESSNDAYWGYMNRNIWDWLRNNRT